MKASVIVAVALALGVMVPMQATEARASPIRRVLTMLTMMDKKVRESGEAEQGLFDKFMCYCSENQGNLQHEIKTAQERVPLLQSNIVEATSLIAQLKIEIVQHKKDLDEADKSLSEATEIRNKESADYQANKADSVANLAALAKAITALEAGITAPEDAAASFLQADTVSALRRLVGAPEVSGDARETIESFLDDGASMKYTPASSQILGMLKQMNDNMNQDLTSATSDEANAAKEYAAMHADKTKLIVSSKGAILEKTDRVSKESIDLVNTQADLDTTQVALQENQKVLAELSTQCHAKQSEWMLHKNEQTEELRAIMETTKILNNGDAMNMFKDSLPTPPSFLELSAKDRRAEALRVLRASRNAPGALPLKLNLIALALGGRKVGFDQIIKLIDERLTLKGTEQDDDDGKKIHCQGELDKAAIKKASLIQTISDTSTMIEEKKATAKGYQEEVEELVAGVKELDVLVKEATEQRQAEHSENVDSMASNHAAIQLLQLAAARLSEFYDKKADDASFIQQAPNTAAPEVKYKKSDDGEAVQALIAKLMNELKTEMDTIQSNEKEAQLDYEEALSLSKDKRALDAKSIDEKQGTIAGLEAGLHKLRGERKKRTKESTALQTYTEAVHADCDTLLEKYESWKQEREQEKDSLVRAKKILSGV